MIRSIRALFASGLVAGAVLIGAASPGEGGAPTIRPRVIATLPHDKAAFTEGLFYLDGHLFESTGLSGQSVIRETDSKTGRVLREAMIPPHLFGEGIVNWGREIVSVTWQSGIGFRWDRKTFKQLSSFRYPGEGWALTQDGNALILSDGTPYLRFLDPRTFAERRRLHVTDGGLEVRNLNEIEFVRGEILANIWHQDRIARIDPKTGDVTGWIDLTAIARTVPPITAESVANGIAWDARHGRLFVTGKNWPKIFVIAWPPRG